MDRGRKGAGLSRETGCGEQGQPSGGQSKDVREKQCCVAARKGRHGMVEIKILCFRWLSPFSKCVQKGLPGFA
jgi:hypothetical protein